MMGTGGPLEMATRWQIGEGVSEEPFWGEQFTAKMKQAVGHSIDWIVHAEDLPEEHNRVTLDHDLRDSDGLPGAKISYTTSDNTHRILDFGNGERVSLNVPVVSNDSGYWEGMDAS